MSEFLQPKATKARVELEDLGPGIRGRVVPPEERILSREVAQKFLDGTSEAFQNYMKKYVFKDLFPEAK